MVGYNLFLISFENEEDLESILKGCPWFFRRQLIIFKRLKAPTERKKIRMVLSPFWLKVGPCPPECDKDDLMNAIGSTFGRLIRSEITGEFCRLKINLDVQKPLRRGLFVSTEYEERLWVPFKYENVPNFCFGCRRMGHGLVDCDEVSTEVREKSEEELPHSFALKAETNLRGKESYQFGVYSKKAKKQCFTLGFRRR